MSQAVDRSVCRVKLRPGQRSAKAASACFGASGMNNTVFEPSRQTGACDSAEHQVAEVKDSLHDQQTRLLDEADAKVQTENQARRFTLGFSLCTRQSWQASRKTRLLALGHCLERERAYSKQNPAERAYSEQNSTGPSDQNSSVYILRAVKCHPKFSCDTDSLSKFLRNSSASKGMCFAPADWIP